MTLKLFHSHIITLLSPTVLILKNKAVDKTLGDSWRDQKNLFFANSEEDIRDFVMYFKSVAGILKVRELSDFEPHHIL